MTTVPIETQFSGTQKDAIRNEVMKSKNKSNQHHLKLEMMKGQWAGHLARMPNNRWAKKTTEWTPREGRRARGRPKRRWREDIEERAGGTWTHMAQDRSAWKQLWRPPASSGVTG